MFYICIMLVFGTITGESLFRALPNIYDGTFLQKQRLLVLAVNFFLLESSIIDICQGSQHGSVSIVYKEFDQESKNWKVID